MARQGRQGGQDVPVNELTKALDGIDFPAGKDELLQQADRNNAPNNVKQVIRDLPTDRFNSMAGVTQAYGEIEGGGRRNR